MKWGQNFVVDKNLIKRIVDNISPNQKDNFLEIGPGDGSLTRQIYPYVNEMVVVEIDPLLIKKLQIAKNLKGLHIIHKDILLQDICDLPISNPLRVVGNIPYNITSPIIFWQRSQKARHPASFYLGDPASGTSLSTYT